MLHLPQASDFTARALPANPFLATDLHAAFNLCLGLESRNPVPLLDPPAVLCARVLGYTLIEAPSSGHIAESINERSSDDGLLALGKYYIQRLLRAAKRPIPPPSEHPSRPDLDDVQELCEYITQKASLTHSTAKQAAFVRDGFHCMIKTHLYDAQYFERNRSTIIVQDPGWDGARIYCTISFNSNAIREIWAKKKSKEIGIIEKKSFPISDFFAVTRDVRIERNSTVFPEGLNSVPSDEREWVASVWSATGMFGIHMKELDGAGIHRLENILTLSPSLHDFFDQLALWLEAVDNQPNTYTVVSAISGVLERLPRRTVTFTTPDPEALPLPSPAYLAIHAACCRVAHLSGAADYVEKVLREEEEIRERVGGMCILAEHGSSMDLFEQYIAAV